MSISYNSSSTGVVKTFRNPSSKTIAMVTPNSNPETGHIVNYTMQINIGKASLCAAAIAHEFGHIAGLSDLYVNDTTLMADEFSGNVLSPTDADKWGSRVITGAHSSHVWRYKFYKTTSSGNMHKKYCTQCEGFKSYYCTYGSSNSCDYCGIPYGIGINSNVEFSSE